MCPVRLELGNSIHLAVCAIGKMDNAPERPILA
jgi:hypothetical protein